MSLVSRKYVPHTIAIAVVGAVIVALLAPAEQRLGDTVKLIYLHASVTWIALRAGPLLSVGIVVFIVVLLSMAGRIFHPTSAIRDSDSLVIKGAVLVIVLLMMVASVQITRLFAARLCLPESAA